MLYERWRTIVERSPGKVALRDVPSGRSWTFEELFMEGENRPAGKGAIVFPRGNSADFVFALLGGWREGLVTCPLEPGQPLPQLALPPAPCIHLKTTSATTGAPRCVAFTAPQLAADVDNIVATMGLRNDSPSLGTISLAHSYGLSSLVLPLLLHGIPLILAGQHLPEVVKGICRRETGLTLPAVPALWRAWHSAGAISPNLRLAISAGARLPIALEEEVFRTCGVKIHNFYGSSECGGIAYDGSDRPRRDESFVGRPLVNVGLSVGEDGCLVVASEAVAEGYWPPNDKVLSQGRFKTNDLAKTDDGSVFLQGRLDDQINVAGRKVNPATIEAALLGHPAVSDCLVFGVPQAAVERGESIVACVSAQSVVTDRELREFLQDRLPAWQVPREWWRVESLTPNERGKSSRAEWRKQFLEKPA